MSATLAAGGGEYAQLYNTYFRHQSPDYRPGEGFMPVHAAAIGGAMSADGLRSPADHGNGR